MLRSDKINRICCICLAVMLVITTLLWGVIEAANAGGSSRTMGYENRLFDQSCVHEIYLTAADWDSMIANAAGEEYIVCDAVIDGEKYASVAIRPKGNTSLSSVTSMGSSRYSFKLEFDHFDKNMNYHGLDKLSLNNLIQDATAMKDYLAYTLMNKMGVPAPLCSYVKIYVNGEYWGLYLAVEGVEDGFLDRNSMGAGELYKPDSMSFGGGRGNGGGFDIEKFRVSDSDDSEDSAAEASAEGWNSFPSFGGQMPGFNGQMPDFGSFSGQPSMPSGFDMTGFDASSMTPPDNVDMSQASSMMKNFNFSMGSDDVKLVYSDDSFDSYSNIFNNAKTDVSNADKTRLIETLKKLNEGDSSVVDADEVIRYLVVHSFLCNDDSYTGMMVHNYYLYEEDGVLSIIPWDYNLAFGGFSAGTNATSTVNSSIDSPVTGGTTSSRPLIAWIFEDEEALNKYHGLYSEMLETCFENGWLSSEIERVWEMIKPCLEDDPIKFYTMEEFEKGVSTLKSFCEKRAESIRNQLSGTNETVDASDIATSDMGSMNSSNGGMSGFSRDSFSMKSRDGSGRQRGSSTETSADTDAVTSATAAADSVQAQSPADANSTQAGMPDMSSFTGSQSMSQSGASGMPDMGGFADFNGSQAQVQASADTVQAQPSTEPTATGTQSDEESAGYTAPAMQPGEHSGFSMPGGYGSTGYPASTWIWLSVLAAALVAALILIKKASNHN